MYAHDLHRSQPKSPITSSRVVVVEGHDTFQFLKALLKQLNLLNEIEIRNYGGINDLGVYLETLKSIDGFEKVNSLGIIRDAEKSAKEAFDSVCKYLKNSAFEVPARPATTAKGTPKVSVFILPDCVNPGMLETLCLQAVKDDPVVPCVDQYFKCLQQEGWPMPDNITKARMRTFLASRKRPNLLLGQAAHEGYWPWENPIFDILKNFLRAI